MGLAEPYSVSEELLSTNTYAPLGAVDMGVGVSLSYLIKVVTNNLHWTVYGANLADFSDEVVAQSEATITVGTPATYLVAQAPYRYYRAKIKAASAGNQGTATIVGVVKG